MSFSRTLLREKDIRHAGISRVGDDVEVRFRDAQALAAAQRVLTDQLPDLQWTEVAQGNELRLVGRLKPEAARRVQEQALKQ
ncbi:hypothetical protein OFM36_34995, partial [Escherichia coli]|nr:hypothetical protein [Escherichia coli]